MENIAVKIYDRNMQLLALLENAYSVGYETPFNGLWKASFTLPANDEKNAECQPFNFVEINDNGEHIGLFRILTSTTQRTNDGLMIEYSCEHVIATLLDDVLFQYHTVGNLGFFTSNVIEYILNKQTIQHWKLGTCSFARQFEYNWENETLYAALFSVSKPFDTPYMWKWDTSTYPWTLSLVEPPTGAETVIRYGHNMTGITKEIDPTSVITRIYPLGYGEGVNQLGIAEINNGVPYLDADTQAQFGIVKKVWVDRRFTSAESLKARAQAMLDEMKVPRVTYKVDAAELYALTKDPVHKFRTGSEVHVNDEELGIDYVARVVNVRKQDIKGQPGKVVLELANRTQDITGSMAELGMRQRINETYAQGATIIDTQDFADNCDPQHPAKLRFWVADEAIRINKVLLSFRSEPFRAYSQAVEGGGAYIGSVTSEAGGADIVTSGDSGIDVIKGWGWTEEADGHSHLFEEVRGHKHNISLPNHVHNVDINIPEHVHPIRYGIYEGPTASTVTVKVDGNTVPDLSINEDSVDIIDYLSTDSEGKIERGKWHEIEIVPNRLSRIECAVVVQQFIQSRGGTSA